MQAPYDILIIGGGINGCALARYASKCGFSVALLEKNDFGCGVTSRSTRLIHGGLRYLESFQFQVVKESLHDRRALLEEFPGLVEPLKFLIPIYETDRRPPWYISIGLTLYGWLAGGGELARHVRFSAVDARAYEPGVDAKGLTAAFQYYDAQVEAPERLCLEMALEAEAAGADIRNHAPVEELLVESGRVVGVKSRGQEIRAQVVVNATGAWIDRILTLLPDADHEPLLTRLNGAHIIVKDFPGAPRCAVYHEARSDGRPFFIVPWLDAYLIGTTETPYDGDPDCVLPLDREIDYLIREVNELFPGAYLDREAVRYSYAGSRPMLRARGKNLNRASRDHEVFDHETEDGVPGLISMVGGKLTTAPSFAWKTLLSVGQKLGRTVRVERPNEAGRRTCEDRRLARLYGPRANELTAYLAERPETNLPVVNGAAVTVGEILFAAEQEKATTLADILLRRTMLAYHPDYQPAWAEAVAEAASGPLQWEESDRRAQLAEYEAELDRTLVRA